MQEVLHDIATLSGHTERLTAVDFAPGRGDRVLSAGKDGAVAIWTIIGEESAEADLLRHSAAVAAARFWPDDRAVLLASEDATTRLFDLEAGEETTRFTTAEAMKPGSEEPSSFARSLAKTVDAAGQVVAAVVPLGVLITAAQRGGDQAAAITACTASASAGRVAALDAKLRLTVYDLVTAEAIRSWTVPAENGAGLMFLANGTLAAACSSRVTVFDERLAKPASTLRAGKGGVAMACELGNDRLAIVDNARQLCIADLVRHAVDVILKLPHAPVAIAPSGPDAVVVADGKRRVARIRLDRPGDATWHDVPGGKIRGIDGSDDGGRIAIASDDLKVRVFEFREAPAPSPRP